MRLAALAVGMVIGVGALASAAFLGLMGYALTSLLMTIMS